MTATTGPTARVAITGSVTGPAGAPAADVRCRAVARRPGRDELGTASPTDADGRYALEVDAAGLVGIVVEVVDDGGAVLVRSAPHATDGSTATVDLVVPAPAHPSVFDADLAAVTPLLGGAALTDLVEDAEHRDVTLLAERVGRDPVEIARLVLAHRHAEATGVAASAFFGLLDGGQPDDLAALVARPRDALVDTLTAASVRGRIPAWSRAAAEQAVDSLRAARLDRLVDGTGDPPTPLVALLRMAVPERDARARLGERLLEDEPLLPERPAAAMRAAASSTSDPDRHAAERLALVLRLAQLTETDPAVVERLLARFDDGELTEPADLGWWDEADWDAVLAEVRTSDPARAQRLRASAAAEFPTRHAARRLADDPDRADLPSSVFLRDTPAFDLRSTLLDTAAPGGAPATEDGRRELAEMQRVFRIAPDYDAMQALRSAGIGSAMQVARTDRAAFVRRFGPELGEAAAADVHERASQAHATASHLVAENHRIGDVPTAALADRAPTVSIPDWGTLFTSPDTCACDQCRSVFGLPAYLADLLHFLEERGDAAGHPLSDELFRRRPDLRWIELGCDNSDLLVPYVDLVLELLERAVDPDATDWSAIDAKHPPTAAQRAELQTVGTEAERRATPQHVSTGAYDVLRRSPYPWGLPFDGRIQEIRTWLTHLGTSRHGLMAALSPATGWSGAVAAEYLGMIPAVRAVVEGTATFPLTAHYGLPSGAALPGDLVTVRTLLDAAGSTYPELLSLIDMRFVDPSNALVLESSDAEDPDTCDTTKLRLGGLDEPMLGRLHRFVRLRRVLGWSDRTLDRVLAAFGGTLGPDTVGVLAGLGRLADRTGLPPERLLGFWAPLDTHLYPADTSPARPGPGDPCPYDRVFPDPGPDAPHPLRLRADRSDLETPADRSDPAVVAALLGGLGVSHDELGVLLGGVDGGPAAVGSGALDLAALTALHRTVALARAIGLPLDAFGRAVALAGSPFPVEGEGLTADVVDRARAFVERLDALAEAGLRPVPVEAALAARQDTSPPVLPSDAELARTLADLVAALRTVFDRTAVLTDDTGDSVRTQLAALGWDAALVDDAMATLRGTVVYSARLDALPSGVTLSEGLREDLRGAVRHVGATVSFSGPMTVDQRDLLTALSSDVPYREAVTALFEAPRRFVTTRMAAFTVPTSTAPLATLPTGVTIPVALAGVVFHDGNAGRLCLRGFLGPQQTAVLRAVSTDQAFQAAVDALIGAQGSSEPAVGDAFLDTDAAAALFDEPTLPAARFALVLAAAQPHLRRTLGAAVVEQRVADATGVPAPTAGALLARVAATGLSGTVLDALLDPAFVSRDPAVELTRAVAAPQLTGLLDLHRAAVLATGLRFDAADLLRTGERSTAAGWLDVATLPPPGADAAARRTAFAALCRTADLVRLRDAVPGGTGTLTAVFDAVDTGSSRAEVLAVLAARTRWSPADIADVCAAHEVDPPAAFRDERALLRLTGALTGLTRLGVPASLATGWTAEAPTPADAVAARQAAHARHPVDEDWAAVAGPLTDELREHQRAALVAHLVAHPPSTPSGPAWTDAYELYQHFLVDVEMGPCRTTTRIALATQSVQLFVQRCLLNLEPAVTLAVPEGADDPLGDWDWVGRYRVWEANRRAFCHPENYLRPELRPDKSPFFLALENALKQRDVTDETVEAAYRTYLEQLDAVARLQPCGMYRQVETDPATGKRTVDVLHTFARTWVTPHVYYYRRLVHGIRWTAWETVDLDIQGDHLMPVIWKGRLFLFWPLFVQTAEQKPFTMPKPDETVPDPDRRWQTQFAWSEYKNGKWLAKQLITDRIDAVVEKGGDTAGNFLFRADAEFATDGNLVVSCYKKRELSAEVVRSGAVTLSTSKAARTTDPVAEITLGSPPSNTRHVGVEFVEQPSVDGRLGHQLAVPTDVVSKGTPHLLLPRTPGVVPFRILYPNHYDAYPVNPFVAGDETSSFFFVDGMRAYFVVPDPPQTVRRRPKPTPVNPPTPVVPPTPGGTPATPAGGVLAGGSSLDPATDGPVVDVLFTTFYHPFVEMLIGKLAAGGVRAMLARDVQVHPDSGSGSAFDFAATYGPTLPARVIPAGEEIDFDFLDGYSLYNWELFFHAPLLLAQRLAANQRFAEAQQWLHTIFNPTDRSGGEVPQRYWQTKPFFETSEKDYADQRIERVLEDLAAQQPPAALTELVQDWRDNPFQPDLIARIRTTAYQKAVVMCYLDVLLGWADLLFRQDTAESTTQATQLYVLAAEILGRRPEEIRPRREPAPQTYAELSAAALDPFSNALVAAELLLPVQPAGGGVRPPPPPGMPAMLYFRVPRNDKLLGYWDTVADRLDKIRRCLTIDGAVSVLPPTAPPIDPAALVAAVAGGHDVSSALADLDAPLPGHRFTVMAAKANQLVGEARTLASGLLGALEKRDGEQIARLRSEQEIRMLGATRLVRATQVDEAVAALGALQRSRETAVAKKAYYAARPFMNDGESAHVALATSALDMQEAAASLDMTANILGLIPDVKLGTPTTIGATFGGTFLTQALRAFSSALNSQAGLANSRGSLSATLGGYARRADEWAFQADQATREVVALDQQIAAARLRVETARTELTNHDLQAANAREADTLLRTKFTGEELQAWTIERLSQLYFDAYRLAYDTARRAEQAYRYELGLTTSDFVRFGNWDSLHKGLTAADHLSADISRMEASHLELDVREYELTKRVSLAGLDPAALVALRRDGECYVSLPECLFDLDGPGHYFRRTHSMAFTLPAVTGSFSSLNLTATLLRSSIRTRPALLAGRYARTEDGDPRFRDLAGTAESVVTSHGVEDTGTFDPAGGQDGRRRPFEGTGVVGEWHLRLPKAFPQFDRDSLRDVVMHVRYTAREGGALLAGAVEKELRDAVNQAVTGGGGTGLAAVVSAADDLPDRWHRFLHPVGGDEAPAELTLPLSTVWLPFPFRHQDVTVDRVQVLLHLADDVVDDYRADTPLRVTVTSSAGPKQDADLTSSAELLNGTPSAVVALTAPLTPEPRNWTITATRGALAATAGAVRTADRLPDPSAVRDVLVVVHYTLG